MVVLDDGLSRFQFRAVALVWNNDRILVHRAATDPFWALPGGRVELHEAAAEALSREILEELGSRSSVGPLRLVIENFFELNGRVAHELGFYYDVELHSPPPYSDKEIVWRGHEEDVELEFRWALPSQLTDLDLKPTALLPILADMPTSFTHIVHRDIGS
jgi:8-oxo-dGTP pyrophosphatase MutT (NUDIX family)